MKTGIKGNLFDLHNTLIDRQAAADAKVRKLVAELFPQVQDPVEFENIVQKLLTWDEYGSIPKIHMYSMLAKEYGLSAEQRESASPQSSSLRRCILELPLVTMPTLYFFFSCSTTERACGKTTV